MESGIIGATLPGLRKLHPGYSLSALCLFEILPEGFHNADLRNQVAALLSLDPGTYLPGRMTYDLRRLRLHGLIERRPHSNRYRVTQDGIRIILFFTRAEARLFNTVLAIEQPLTPE